MPGVMPPGLTQGKAGRPVLPGTPGAGCQEERRERVIVSESQLHASDRPEDASTMDGQADQSGPAEEAGGEAAGMDAAGVAGEAEAAQAETAEAADAEAEPEETEPEVAVAEEVEPEVAVTEEAEPEVAGAEAAEPAGAEPAGAEPAAAEAVDAGAEAGEEEPAEAEEAEAEEDPVERYTAELRLLPGDWYVVHSYAGYENRVKGNLESRTQSLNMEDYIFQVEVPVHQVTEIKGGKRQQVQEKVLPGYILVRMDLTDESWAVVRNTPGVTGFVGLSSRPSPLSLTEVAVLRAPEPEEKVAKKAESQRAASVDYEVG